MLLLTRERQLYNIAVMMSQPPLYDSGQSWVALGGVTLMYVMVGLHTGALGIMTVAFINHLDLQKSQAAWIAGCSTIVGPIAGKAIIFS